MDTDCLYKFAFSSSPVRARSVDWSRSNQIAIAGDSGVYILEPERNVFKAADSSSATTSMPSFRKCFVPVKPPDRKDVNSKLTLTNEQFQQLPLYDKYLFKMHTFIAATSDNSFAECRRGIRFLRWAPFTKESVFSVLTLNYELILYQKSSRSQWEPVVNITDLLMEHFLELETDSISSEANETLDYKTVKERLNRFALMTMEWSDLIKDGKDGKDGEISCTLLCTSRNGLFTAWTITATPFGQLDVTFDRKWLTGLGQISSLCLWKNYIFIGTAGGQLVAATPLSDSSLPPSPTFLSTRSLEYRTALFWEDMDGIPVNHIIRLKGGTCGEGGAGDGSDIDDNKCLLLCCKSTHMLIYKFEAIQSGNTWCITSCEQRHEQGIFQMPISSLTEMDDSSILMASADGRVVRVRIPENIYEHIEQSEIAPINGAYPLNCSFTGLVTSPNRVLTGALQVIEKYHDSSTVKESAQFLLFSNLNQKRISGDLAKLNADKRTISRGIEGIRDYLLALECLIAKEKSLAGVDIKKMLAGNQHDSLLTLKCGRIIALRAMSSMDELKLSEDEANDLKCQVQSAEETVLRKHCEHILSPEQQQKNPLDKCSGNQIKSMRFISCWYRTRFPTSDLAMRSNEHTFDGALKEEKCPICSSPLDLISSPTRATCSSGHSLPRCAISLLICDLLDDSNNQFVPCPHCGSLYIKPSIWPDLSEHCIYCY